MINDQWSMVNSQLSVEEKTDTLLLILTHFELTDR